MMDLPHDGDRTRFSNGSLPAESEGLLRFARLLDGYSNAEQLIPSLPLAFNDLVAADAYILAVEQTPVSPLRVVGSDPQKAAKFYEWILQNRSLYRWLHRHQDPLVISPSITEPRAARMLASADLASDRCLHILPLKTGIRRIGTLCAARPEVRGFSRVDTSLLELAAEHTALVLDDRLLIAESEATRQQLKSEQTKLELILDLNNRIVSSLDLKDLIRNISPSIRKLMHLDAIGLSLPTPDESGLEVYALDFPDSKGYILPGEILAWETRPGRVFRTGKPWIGDATDVSDPDSGLRRALQEGFRAQCSLPLLRYGRPLGVLSVARLRKDSFTRDDVDFLHQIAGQIAIAIDNALAYRKISELSKKLVQEKLYLEDEIRSELYFEEIIGNSPILLKALRQVEAVAPTDSTVLIHGETGSGKELIARAVHNLSRRKSHSFVKLNCAAIPMGLLESELFGHEKGAFTGAIAQRLGRFELASGGTIFLDEVGEIPLELQPKLLRVLQEREFERLGSSRTLHTDARLIAATNRDLNEMVESQKFRSDLYYRLNVFPIYVPPLRERAEDIPFLVRHFAQHFARLMKKEITTISTETMNALIHYPWPGNIRELQNVIERAVILSIGPELRVPISDLKIKSAETGGNGRILTIEEMERQHILSVLEHTNWVFSGANGAAAKLGLKRSTLQFRVRKLGIHRPTKP